MIILFIDCKDKQQKCRKCIESLNIHISSIGEHWLAQVLTKCWLYSYYYRFILSLLIVLNGDHKDYWVKIKKNFDQTCGGS